MSPPAHPAPPAEGSGGVGRIDARFSSLAPRLFLAAYLALALQSWWVETRLGADFDVFHLAAHRAVAAQPLYHIEELYHYKYSPAFALLISPLAALPRPAAALVWNLLSALALASFSTWGARRFGRDAPFTSQLAVFVLALPFSIHLLRLGQADALMLWLASRSEDGAERHPAWSGALWAAAVLGKLPFLVLLPLALLNGQWRRLAWFTAFLAVGLVLPAVRYGVAGALAETGAWHGVLAAAAPEALCNRENQSVWAIACTYLAQPPGTAYLAWVAVLGGGAVLAGALSALAAWRRDPATGRLAALALALWLSAFLSPQGWRTNLVGAIPALFMLLTAVRDPGAGRVRIFGGILLAGVFLVQRLNYEVVGPQAFFWLLAHQQFGVSTAVAVLGGLAATAALGRIDGDRADG